MSAAPRSNTKDTKGMWWGGQVSGSTMALCPPWDPYRPTRKQNSILAIPTVALPQRVQLLRALHGPVFPPHVLGHSHCRFCNHSIPSKTVSSQKGFETHRNQECAQQLDSSPGMVSRKRPLPSLWSLAPLRMLTHLSFFQQVSFLISLMSHFLKLHGLPL